MRTGQFKKLLKLVDLLKSPNKPRIETGLMLMYKGICR